MKKRPLLKHLYFIGFSIAILTLFSATNSDNKEIDSQYKELESQIKQLDKFKKVASSTFNEQSLITEKDRDPLDIVLRRISALIGHLESVSTTNIAALKSQFETISKKADNTPVTETKNRKLLYNELCGLRRKLMFSNSQINFTDILFIKKELLPEPEMQGNHMCDQFFGFHVKTKGGLFVLKNAFSEKAEAKDLLEDSKCQNGPYEGKKLEGGFLSPELRYDGKEVMFAYTEAKNTPYVWDEQTTYHIFSVDTDGKNLKQLTFGTQNDFDPCYLPNGRVAFISERRGGYGRCHGRPVPSFTLHSMHTDGDDITMLSPHETNEWQPSVTNNGMILFTRWDYVDRGHGQAHHPWICYPDGRDPRDVHGNYVPTFGNRSNMETNLRAIPNSEKFVGVTAGHHAQNYGSIILIDPNTPDDNHYAPIKRVTPDQLFPETEYWAHTGEGMYATPYPISEYFYICVYSDKANDGSRRTNHKDHNYGIYLIDAFGNKELLYRDNEISCYDPIPLVARPVPPVIPHMTMVGLPPVNGKKQPKIAEDKLPKTAGVYVVDVYNGRYPMPKDIKIKEIRIVQLLPKSTPIANDPVIGHGSQKGARQILGTVPVEDDGSAYFEIPVNIPVYFQALDSNGVAVQTMRSATWVAPGETLSCKGCHENRQTAVMTNNFPKAIRKKPSTIKPEVEGSNPFSYPRLVQPVLDAKCVNCHSAKIAKGDSIPDLRSMPINRNWFTSFHSLRPYCHFYDPEDFTIAETKPMEFGANASQLYKILKEGHHGVKLTAEEMRRITLWLDTNCNFFGAYNDTEAQLEGKIVYPDMY